MRPFSSILGRCASVAVLLSSSFVLPAIAVPAQPAILERAPLHVGFTPSTFRNVNATDAEAAFLVFAQTVGRQQGYNLDTSTRLFESTAACEAEIKKGGLSLVVLDALEYLDMDIPEMEPAFVHHEQGIVLKDYLLLTRRESGLNTLSDLRNKEIAVLSSKSGNVSMNWLEVLLLEHGLGSPKNHFKKVDIVAKPSKTVLPVFFGGKPACVVDRLSFQTMVELNPQLGETLAPIAVSGLYLDSVTCITRNGYSSKSSREDFMRSIRDLHLNPAGRQILTLFKVDKLVPFKEEYLEGVRNLRKRCAQLKSTEPVVARIPVASPSPVAQTMPLAKVVHDQIQR